MRTLFAPAVMMFLCLLGSHAYAKPDLQIDSKTFDFGEVLQGDEVRHVFKFVNAGDEPLIIFRIRSSCGCTAALVSEKNLSPGATGEVQANFDSTRFGGAVSKTIYIYSNDPVYPVQQVHIKGKVKELVAIEPAKINFGVINGDQTLSAQIKLRNQGNGPLTLNPPTTTAKELQVDMQQTVLAKNQETSLELMFTPKPGAERFSAYVLVPVDGVPKNELRIPVYATIK